MFNKKNKGFTLIELLVVITIIGILAGIVVVAVGNSRNKATNAKVIASLENICKTIAIDAASSSTGLNTLTNGKSGTSGSLLKALGITTLPTGITTTPATPATGAAAITSVKGTYTDGSGITKTCNSSSNWSVI